MIEETKHEEAKVTMNQFEALLDEYMVKKAPFTLPDNVKEFIVKVSPYIVILSAIVILPAVLLLLGIGAALAPLALVAGASAGAGLLSGVVSLVALVMEVMAVPGLFKRTAGSWRLVYYSTLVSLLASLLTLNIIGGIIGAIIGWYFLFQVKSLYKN